MKDECEVIYTERKLVICNNIGSERNESSMEMCGVGRKDNSGCGMAEIRNGGKSDSNAELKVELQPGI